MYANQIFENKLTLENRDEVARYLLGAGTRISSNSPTSLYMWRNINMYNWEIIDGLLCMDAVTYYADKIEESHFMRMPMSATGEYDVETLRQVILKAKARYESEGYVFRMKLVPEHMLDLINEAIPGIEWEDDPVNYDYLYLTEKLSTFSGRKLHSKKNHLNYFLNNYEYEYVELTSEMADEAYKYILEFDRSKDIPDEEMESLLQEEEAVYDVLNNLEAAGFVGGAILIDGKIEALAIGGQLDDKTIVEHVEKANAKIRGLYPAIVSEFCKQVKDKYEFINREEDMGIENLRKAKESYKPVEMIKKYVGRI